MSERKEGREREWERKKERVQGREEVEWEREKVKVRKGVERKERRCKQEKG